MASTPPPASATAYRICIVNRFGGERRMTVPASTAPKALAVVEEHLHGASYVVAERTKREVRHDRCARCKRIVGPREAGFFELATRLVWCRECRP